MARPTYNKFEVAKDPAKALLVLRIIWAAQLMAQLGFIAIVLVFRSEQASPDILFYAPLALAAIAAPAAFLTRGIVFGSARPVPMAKYFTGTVVFLSILESVSLFSLVTILLGQPLTLIAIPAISMALQAASFPTSAPTEGAPTGSGS